MVSRVFLVWSNSSRTAASFCLASPRSAKV